jgi:hypothetical protein
MKHWGITQAFYEAREFESESLRARREEFRGVLPHIYPDGEMWLDDVFAGVSEDSLVPTLDWSRY